MYIVMAYHSMGHGPAGSPILVTTDLVKAVDTATAAELLGYGFHGLDDGAGIITVQQETVYRNGKHHSIALFRRRGSDWVLERDEGGVVGQILRERFPERVPSPQAT